ncbi:MAG: histidine phosphatase family protein [Halopseudomonas aestusnigri]
MKTIYIARHASTKPALENQHDTERPLTLKGQGEAQWLGQFLLDQPRPSQIVTSTAIRARETSNIVNEILGSELSIEIIPALYLAPSLQILKILKSLPDTPGSLALIGHNPGLSQFLLDISGDGSNETAIKRIYRGLPPAGLAILESKVDSWQDISQENTTLLNLLHPGE